MTGRAHEEPLCRCGSGLYRFQLRDAAGIFCAFVCDECEKATRTRFNPAIFESGTLYGATGEEDDIGVRPGEDY